MFMFTGNKFAEHDAKWFAESFSVSIVENHCIENVMMENAFLKHITLYYQN